MTKSLKMTRRSVLVTAGAATGTRFLPRIAGSNGGRRILTVYYDKALGAMRAIEKIVP